MAGPVLFQTLQPITDDEIHATVQRAVAALMAAYGPVKACRSAPGEKKELESSFFNSYSRLIDKR